MHIHTYIRTYIQVVAASPQARHILTHTHAYIHTGSSSLPTLSPQTRHAPRQRFPWSKFDHYYSTDATATATATAVTKSTEDDSDEGSDAATDYAACAGCNATGTATGTATGGNTCVLMFMCM